MSDQDTIRQRLIDNELLVRTANEEAKLAIEEHTPYKVQPGLALDFYCECSALDCQERVDLSLAQYELLHQRNDRFVIIAGHLSPSVEKIVDTEEGFIIVEKYALPA